MAFEISQQSNLPRPWRLSPSTSDDSGLLAYGTGLLMCGENQHRDSVLGIQYGTSLGRCGKNNGAMVNVHQRHSRSDRYKVANIKAAFVTLGPKERANVNEMLKASKSMPVEAGRTVFARRSKYKNMAARA